MGTRITWIVLSLFVSAMTLFIAGSVAARPPGQKLHPVGISLASPVASKISYQGRLTDAAGNPLDGNYNLVFQLWDDAAGGSQVGSNIVHNNVPVDNGLFTVGLEVNPAEFSGEGRWLQVQVNGQWLTPRQELLPVPYALSLRPGAGIAGEVDFSGALNVSNVGAGPGVLATSGPVMFDAPESQFGLFAAGRDGGVFGFTDGTDKFGGAFTGSGGVMGQGQNGPGGSFSSVDGVGLAAYSESNPAVEATSSEDVAVYATTGTIPLILIQGKQAVVAYGEQNGVIAWGGETGGTFEGSIGVKGTGGHRGIDGRTESGEEGAAGVYGESTNMQADGVRGQGAHGIHGVGYTGVYGEGDVGVHGEGTVGVGGKSETNGGAGVTGEATGYSGVGVRGTSDFGIGVEGAGEKGVQGTSSVGFGVWGEAPTGVYGSSTTDGGTGVQGVGPRGVYGESSADGGEGVHGHGTGSRTEGVLGTSDNAAGVYGISSGSTSGLAVGVRGQTDATWGLATNENLFVGGSCTGCTLAFVARNADAGRLEVGDVVSVVGVAPPLKGQRAPVLEVRRGAVAGGGVPSVVQSRATIDVAERLGFQEGAARAELFEMPGGAPGPVASGEYLFIVVQGLVQVRADASAGAIRAGDPVGPAETAGHAHKLNAASPTVPVLGRALEPLDEGTRLIWVLILGR